MPQKECENAAGLFPLPQPELGRSLPVIVIKSLYLRSALVK